MEFLEICSYHFSSKNLSLKWLEKWANRCLPWLDPTRDLNLSIEPNPKTRFELSLETVYIMYSVTSSYVLFDVLANKQQYMRDTQQWRVISIVDDSSPCRTGHVRNQTTWHLTCACTIVIPLWPATCKTHFTS